MTQFESLATEIGVPITIDHNGFYTGLIRALIVITNEIILGDDSYMLPWDEQRQMIIRKFRSTFPYTSTRAAR